MFLEETGNMWDLPADAYCVTTNCVLRGGNLVMGGGVAKEAVDRFPHLPVLWGKMVLRHNTHLFATYVTRQDDGWDPSTSTKNIKVGEHPTLLIAFPTKNHYRFPSIPGMIVESAVELMQKCDELGLERVLLPRPGVGLGGLDWEGMVKPLIAPILDERVVVVTFK